MPDDLFDEGGGVPDIGRLNLWQGPVAPAGSAECLPCAATVDADPPHGSVNASYLGPRAAGGCHLILVPLLSHPP